MLHALTRVHARMHARTLVRARVQMPRTPTDSVPGGFLHVCVCARAPNTCSPLAGSAAWGVLRLKDAGTCACVLDRHLFLVGARWPCLECPFCALPSSIRSPALRTTSVHCLPPCPKGPSLHTTVLLLAKQGRMRMVRGQPNHRPLPAAGPSSRTERLSSTTPATSWLGPLASSWAFGPPPAPARDHPAPTPGLWPRRVRVPGLRLGRHWKAPTPLPPLP